MLPVTVPTIVKGMAVGKVGDRLVLVGAAGPDMLGMVPKALNAEVGLAETLVVVEVMLSTEGESSTSVGAQLTLVPGSVGSCASGGEARVVAGAPGTVVAEKRLVNGPVRPVETTQQRRVLSVSPWPSCPWSRLAPDRRHCSAGARPPHRRVYAFKSPTFDRRGET